MKKVYEINDLVLGKLELPDPCPVRIEIDDKFVRLYVGQRDWQWHIDGRFSGCGTDVAGHIRIKRGDINEDRPNPL